MGWRSRWPMGHGSHGSWVKSSMGHLGHGSLWVTHSLLCSSAFPFEKFEKRFHFVFFNFEFEYLITEWLPVAAVAQGTWGMELPSGTQGSSLQTLFTYFDDFIFNDLWANMKFQDSVGTPRISDVLARLSVSCFFPKTVAIKSRRRQKTIKCIQIFGPNFFGRDDPNFLKTDC